MVEPAENFGTIFFAIAIAAMVSSAGVASFPPARDFRVFVGAAVLSGAWVTIMGIQKYYGSWDISSSFFFLDIAYAVIFYFLSIPNDETPRYSKTNVMWAGLVFAVYVIMIAMQIIHFFTVSDFPAENAAIGLLLLITVIIIWGFVRGFGWMVATGFCLVFFAINTISIFYYVESSNILTLLAIILIFAKALRGAKTNLIEWTMTIASRDGDKN